MSQEENQSSERFLGLDEERFEQYEIFISFLQAMVMLFSDRILEVVRGMVKTSAMPISKIGASGIMKILWPAWIKQLIWGLQTQKDWR